MMQQQAERLQRGVYPMVQIVYNKYGFTKGMRDSDAPEDVWQLGGPDLLPVSRLSLWRNSGSIARSTSSACPSTTPPPGTFRTARSPSHQKSRSPSKSSSPTRKCPIKDDKGEYILDYVLGQDMVAWYAQGEITDRTQEHLYAGDKVIMSTGRC